jgi:hypothetical protein
VYVFSNLQGGPQTSDYWFGQKNCIGLEHQWEKNHEEIFPSVKVVAKEK